MTRVASTTPRQMSRIISVLFESVTKPRATHSSLHTRPQSIRSALSIRSTLEFSSEKWKPVSTATAVAAADAGAATDADRRGRRPAAAGADPRADERLPSGPSSFLPPSLRGRWSVQNPPLPATSPLPPPPTASPNPSGAEVARPPSTSPGRRDRRVHVGHTLQGCRHGRRGAQPAGRSCPRVRHVLSAVQAASPIGGADALADGFGFKLSRLCKV